MKILQVVQKPQRRGAEVFAFQLSQELRCAGHEVRTAYLYPNEEENALPLTQYDTVLGGREHHCFEKLPGIHPLLLWRLRRVVEKIRPDVVQVNGSRTVKYGAAVAASVRQRSWVLIYRNIGQPRDWMPARRRSIYSRLVMARLNGVVGVSRITLENVQELYQLSVPTTHIPCAIDAATVVPTVMRPVIRRQTATPLEAPVIVWVGSLTPEKRVDRLIRAADIVKRSIPNLHLWIVGGGPLRLALETQLRTLSLAPNTRFLGVQDQVANYMSAGDLVALPSDTEGMPAVLLEAGLLGLPVVATRVGGVSECVRDGETGILVERNDETGLASALRDLLQQPERRCRLGRAARVWIERNFTMKGVAPQYAAFYRQVLTA